MKYMYPASSREELSLVIPDKLLRREESQPHDEPSLHLTNVYLWA